METRKVKELQIKVKDKEGTEGWISMTEFGSMFLESVGEAVNLTFKKIGKEIKNETEQKGEKDE